MPATPVYRVHAHVEMTNDHFTFPLPAMGPKQVDIPLRNVSTFVSSTPRVQRQSHFCALKARDFYLPRRPAPKPPMLGCDLPASTTPSTAAGPQSQIRTLSPQITTTSPPSSPRDRAPGQASRHHHHQRTAAISQSLLQQATTPHGPSRRPHSPVSLRRKSSIIPPVPAIPAHLIGDHQYHQQRQSKRDDQQQTSLLHPRPKLPSSPLHFSLTHANLTADDSSPSISPFTQHSTTDIDINDRATSSGCPTLVPDSPSPVPSPALEVEFALKNSAGEGEEQEEEEKEEEEGESDGEFWCSIGPHRRDHAEKREEEVEEEEGRGRPRTRDRSVVEWMRGCDVASPPRQEPATAVGFREVAW